VKSYDHLNFSRASVVQFRVSDILRTWIGPLSEKLWPFEFLESFRCSILSVTIYYAPPSQKLWPFEFLESFRCSILSVSICDANRTSKWKVMTIWLAQELPLFNFERLDILCAWIGPQSEKLWPFEFLVSIHSSISFVSIYFALESNLRVNSYDLLNCPIASIVKFRESRYIMRLNRTSELKFMTIGISQELPLINFERLDILCAWIGRPSEKLLPFELLNSFHC